MLFVGRSFLANLQLYVLLLSIIEKSFQNSIFKGTFVILIRIRDG